MSCPLHGDTMIDCGWGRVACWECERLYDNAALWRYLGPDWICPVCERSRRECVRVVIHHDHFLDATWGAVNREMRLRLKPLKLETFRATVICESCNSICATVKQDIPKLPKWFSLSPDEMRLVRQQDGSNDLGTVVRIWESKRTGIFSEKLTAMVSIGVDREAIKSALGKYRPVGQTKHDVTEETRQICARDEEFRLHFATRENDLWLVRYLRAESWTTSMLKSFVYLYHRRHGDPKLERRPQELGPTQFITWLLMTCENAVEADAYRQRCAYWRLRNTGTEG